jgi:C1A family cysteine protease
VPDSVDPKDLRFQTPQFRNPGARSTFINLSGNMPPVYDQENWGAAQQTRSPRHCLHKPRAGEQVPLWGHAVLATGYNSAKRVFRIRNSWSAAHQNGYFDMDYDYILNPPGLPIFLMVYQTLGFFV